MIINTWLVLLIRTETGTHQSNPILNALIKLLHHIILLGGSPENVADFAGIRLGRRSIGRF